MTYQEFDIQNVLEMNRVLETLERKNEEYATADIFSNFREASEITGKAPEAVAFDYDLKHIVSIKDIVNGKGCTLDLWHEKIGDYLAYGLIMNALMIERLKDDTKR